MIIAYICGKPCFTICGKPNFQNQFLITICGNDKIEGKRAKKGQNPLTKHLSAKKAVFEFGLPFAVIFYSIPSPTGGADPAITRERTRTGSQNQGENDFGLNFPATLMLSRGSDILRWRSIPAWGTGFKIHNLSSPYGQRT